MKIITNFRKKICRALDDPVFSDLFFRKLKIFLGVKLLIETTEEVSVDQAFEREASITREFNSFFFFSLLSKKQRERTIIKRDDWRSQKLRRNENGSRNRVSHRLFRVTYRTTLFGFVFIASCGTKLHKRLPARSFCPPFLCYIMRSV